MDSKQVVVKNLTWRLLERFGAHGVSFVVSIVLARLLLPEDYGTIALVTVFTTILQVFVDSGFGNALIQKKDADDIDFSTVFYFNLVVCLMLYGVVFLLSPAIAQFYNRPTLTPIIRVLSLTIVISGVKNIQQAYVSRNLLFRKFFFATLGGTIGAAIVGIIMAYKGFGVWALVVQQIFNATVDTIILWISVKWRPKAVFSWNRLKQLFEYGWKLLAAALLDTVYREMRSLIIGKKYSSKDLAFYNKGLQFPNFIVTNLNTSIDSVLFPVMSSVQNDKEHIKRMTRQSIKISTYAMAPLMMGLAAIAEPLIRLVLTEKWLPCVPFLRIFCVSYMFMPIHTANLNAIKAMGRSDLFLKLEVYKKIAGSLLLLCSMWISVEAMAYSLLISNVISQFINSSPNKQLLNYSYREQLRDILPTVALAAIMGLMVSLLNNIGLADYLTIIIQIIVGALIYILGSVLFRIDSYKELKSIMHRFLHR